MTTDPARAAVRGQAPRPAWRVRSSLAGALVLAMAAVAAGCDASHDASLPPVAVTDSLGTEILTFDRDLLPSSVRIPDEPVLVVGEGSEAGAAGLPLHHVGDALLLTERLLFIIEAGTQEIIRVDLATNGIQRFGGRGDGPAEFRAMRSLHPLEGPGLGVLDSGRRRFVTFDTEGRLLEAEGLAGPESVGGTLTLLKDGEGAFYTAWAPHFASGYSEFFRGEGSLVRLGTPLDTLTTVLGVTTFVGGGVMGSVFFGPSTVFAAGARGVWVGDTSEPSVELWEAPGRPSWIVRWRSAESRHVSEAHREKFLERIAARGEGASEAEIAEVRRVLRFAPEMPAFGDLVAGDDGRLWIGSYLAPDIEWADQPEQEWVVVELAGPAAWRVTTPPGFRLLRAGEGLILGVRHDPLGVQSVRGYRVLWPE